MTEGVRNTVRTLVVKVGTTLLTGERGFDGRHVERIIREVACLKKERDLNVLIVSSGAIGCGMDALGERDRPRSLPLKQATAAIGQSRLMHYYETALRLYGEGLCTAQVLITAGELDDRVTYLNIRNTIQALFRLGKVVPVVNENDSVATEELCFGDNDTLAARVAAKAGADLLVLLSDIDGLYDKNPRKHAGARLIEYVPALTDEVEALAEDTTTETSIGGMKTKLRAARIASAAGLPMVIADGRRDNVLHDVLAGRGPMTYFGFAGGPMSQRKRWIAFGRATRGVLVIDDGAVRALREKGTSLLAAGITAVRGSFSVGDAVQVADMRGRPVAQGLANFDSGQVERIRGRKSAEIRAILGRQDFDEVIHRDNLVLI
jgi:glutamate 5-kinase